MNTKGSSSQLNIYQLIFSILIKYSVANKVICFNEIVHSIFTWVKYMKNISFTISILSQKPYE